MTIPRACRLPAALLEPSELWLLPNDNESHPLVLALYVAPEHAARLTQIIQPFLPGPTAGPSEASVSRTADSH